MTKFDNILISYILEADGPPSPPSSPDSSGSSPNEPGATQTPPPGQDPSKEENNPEEQDDGEEITSPEEFELAKLAIQALFFDTRSVKTKINPKIYDDFENKRNIIPILTHVEHVINKNQSDEGFRIKDKLDSISHSSNTPDIKHKSIADKIKYFSKNQSENSLDQGKRIFWVRIILNALKFKSNNYNLLEDDITPESIKVIFNKLKYDFNDDTRGTYRGFGNNISGPGVF